MDRNATTLVSQQTGAQIILVQGGLSTHHEMCLVLLEYYPRNRFLEQECMSVVDGESLCLALGAKSVITGDDADAALVIDAEGTVATVRRSCKSPQTKL
jgi:hypothetical protein